MRVNEEHVTHPDRAFRFLRFEAAAFAGPRHRHAQLELTWIERGAGVRFVGDSAEAFDDGDLVLLGPQVPHNWTSAPFDPAQPGRATVLQFPQALLQQAVLPELAALRPLAERAACGLAITGTCHAEVTAALQAMREADALQRLALLLTVLRALALQADTLRPIASSPLREDTGGPGRERRIDRVIDWLHRHLAQALDIEAAARIAHVTPAAFSRFFKRETGKTFSTYINDLRCAEACVRLRQGNEPVAAVAEACGYTTLSHFNRAFRERYGRTPREHRRGLQGTRL